MSIWKVDGLITQKLIRRSWRTSDLYKESKGSKIQAATSRLFYACRINQFFRDYVSAFDIAWPYV